LQSITTASSSDQIGSTDTINRRRLAGKDLKGSGCATRRVKQYLYIAERSWKIRCKPCWDSLPTEI